jgi:hypothetical protein
VKPTNELFLMTSGWILLHEIGHIVLNHGANTNPTSEESIEMELAADDWASSWMLDRWRDYRDDVRVFQKRTLGITFGIGLQAGFELQRASRRADIPTQVSLTACCPFLEKPCRRRMSSVQLPMTVHGLRPSRILQAPHATQNAHSRWCLFTAGFEILSWI